MNEKILEIKELLKARQTIEAKRILDDLEKDLEKLESLQKFFEEIKTLVRNLGNSNMINKSEIEVVIEEYGTK